MTILRDPTNSTYALKINSDGSINATSTSAAAALDRELVVTTYFVKTAFTGASVGDTVTQTQILDVSSTPSTVSTIWRNQSTATDFGSVPSAANLTLDGSQAMSLAQYQSMFVSGGLPVTGTFWQTTQPVSINAGSNTIGAVNSLKADVISTGTITTTDAVVAAPGGAGVLVTGASTAGSLVSAVVTGGYGIWDLQVTGLTSGNLYFEGSLDSTTGTDGNWINLNARQIGVSNPSIVMVATSNGVYRGNCSGFKYYRVRSVGTLSGTPAIVIRLSAAVDAISLNSALPVGSNAIGSVQIGSSDTSASGTITATDAVVAAPGGAGNFVTGASTAGSLVSVAVQGGATGWDMSILGLTSGNLYFEGSLDSTTGTDGNWINLNAKQSGLTGASIITVATMNGLYRGNCSGMKYFRVRSVGTLSGTPAIVIRLSLGIDALFLSAPLPAGTSTIGNVGVTTLPSIPTGANAIGSITNTTFSATQATAASLNATVVGTGTFATQISSALPTGANTIGAVTVSGVSTAANQATEIASLSSIDTKLTKAQNTKANSLSVTFASDATTDTIGRIGSLCVQSFLTPTVTASSAYATGNAVGGLITITNAVRSVPLSGLLQSAKVTSASAQSSTSFDVFLFSSNPTGTTVTDKSAFTIATADLSKLIGVVQCTNIIVAGGSIHLADNTSKPFSTAITSIYAVIVARGTPTFTATSDVVLSVGIVQD